MADAGLDADALAQACAAGMFARDGAAQSIGIALVSSGPGQARLALTIGQTMLNGHGIAHGGILFALADTAFAYASNSRNVPHVALDATISFVSPARLGDRVEAIAAERSLGGRTGVYDVTITQPSGDVVALFRGTCYRIRGSVLASDA